MTCQGLQTSPLEDAQAGFVVFDFLF